MTIPIEFQRKFRQLDNDVSSIYELLGEVQKTQEAHGDRLESIGSQLTTIGAGQMRQANRIDSIEADVHDLNAKMGRVETTQQRQGDRLDAIDGRLDGIDARFDGLDTRFGGLETRVDGLDTRFDGLEAKVDTVIDLLRGGAAPA